MTKKELCLIRKSHSQPLVIAQTFDKDFKTTGLSFWFSVKNSTDSLAECLNVLAACFEINSRLDFLVIEKH